MAGPTILYSAYTGEDGRTQYRMMIGRRLSTPVRPKRCSRLTSAKYLYPESESLSLESGKRLNFSDEFLSLAISLKSPQQKPLGLPVGLMPVDLPLHLRSVSQPGLSEPLRRVFEDRFSALTSRLVGSARTGQSGS